MLFYQTCNLVKLNKLLADKLLSHGLECHLGLLLFQHVHVKIDMVGQIISHLSYLITNCQVRKPIQNMIFLYSLYGTLNFGDDVWCSLYWMNILQYMKFTMQVRQPVIRN